MCMCVCVCVGPYVWTECVNKRGFGATIDETQDETLMQKQLITKKVIKHRKSVDATN